MPTCFPFAFLKRRTRRGGASSRQKEVPEVLLEKEGFGIADTDVGNGSESLSLSAFFLPILPPSSPNSGDSSSTAALSSQSEPCLSSSAVLSPSPDTLASSPDTVPQSPDPTKAPLHEAHVQLPLELWAEIFGYVDQRALQDLMLVNQALSLEAERLLYRNVFLGSSLSLAIFTNSIIASPHRAALVTRIHIPSIEDYDPHVSLNTIPILLRRLDKLQHLTLNLFETRLPRDYLFVLQLILTIRFPSLHSLSLRMPLFLDASFLCFLQAHPRLRHLDLGEIPPSAQTDCATFRVPAIASLACTFRLLAALRPAAVLLPVLLPSLTHLHVLACSRAHLARAAELLGPQIVALRLGSVYVPVQHVHHERPAMALHDVAARFPRLRFLQLDMGQEDNRYSRVQAVDYRLKRPAGYAGTPTPSTHAGGNGHRAKRITLVWAFARPKHEGHGVWVAAGYRRFVSKAALEVLREWGCYVERVVCTHGAGVYESLRLEGQGGGEGGSGRLVRVEERGMWEGSWRYA